MQLWLLKGKNTWKVKPKNKDKPYYTRLKPTALYAKNHRKIIKTFNQTQGRVQ